MRKSAERRDARGVSGRLGRRVCIPLLVLAATAAGAAAPLRFTADVHQADSGLKLEIMPGATERPPPSPRVYTYRVVGGGLEDRQARYDPLELWGQQQLLSVWVTSDDVRLALAKVVATPFPSGLPTHVTREDFEERLAEHAMPVQPSDAVLSAWVKALVADSTMAPVVLRPRSRNLRELRVFVSPDTATDTPMRVALLFQLNRSAVERRSAPMHWFAAILHVPRTYSRKRVLETLEKRFIPSLSWAKTTGLRRRDRSDRFQNKAALAESEATSLDSSRQAAAASVSNMQGWWVAHTPHYVFLSNLSTRHRALVKDLQVEIEAMQVAYAKLIPARVPITAISIIRVFATSEEYKAYVGKSLAWSGGLWSTSRRELIVRPIEAGDARDRRTQLRATVYHEAFHQYIHYALGELPPAPWFNEGHATFFENARLRNGAVEVVDSDSLIERCRALAKRGPFPFERILNMDYATFYDADTTRRRENYALAWGLVYYLRKGGPPEHCRAFRKIPEQYVEALVTSRDPAQATLKALEGIDRDALIKDITAFWSSRSRQARARRFRPF